MEKEAVNAYSPLVLAYLGDAVFELEIRARLVEKSNSRPNILNRKASALVCASSQSDMKQHCKNGLALAEFLSGNPKVEFVNYPSLKGDKYYERAMKYLPNGSCGVVSFGVKGGRAAAEEFMKNLKIFAIETHVADARSCCLHPASSTHRQLTEEELTAAGIPGNLVRMSCGLENTEDLVNDVRQALEKV